MLLSLKKVENLSLIFNSFPLAFFGNYLILNLSNVGQDYNTEITEKTKLITKG